MEAKHHAFKITKLQRESLPHRRVAPMFHRCCSELVRCRGASEKLFDTGYGSQHHAFKITKLQRESLPHRRVAPMFHRCCSELVRCRGASEKLFEHRLWKPNIMPSKSQSCSVKACRTAA